MTPAGTPDVVVFVVAASALYTLLSAAGFVAELAGLLWRACLLMHQRPIGASLLGGAAAAALARHVPVVELAARYAVELAQSIQ